MFEYTFATHTFFSRYQLNNNERERILKIHKLILSYVIAFFGSALMADNHELIGGLNPSEPFALNISLCNLKPGKTMNQVDKFVGDYIDWSKKIMWKPLSSDPRHFIPTGMTDLIQPTNSQILKLPIMKRWVEIGIRGCQKNPS